MIHELKHNLDDDALKSFLNDYEEKIMPLASEHFPDIKMTSWVKGIGADNKGVLAGLIYYESMEDYRKY